MEVAGTGPTGMECTRGEQRNRFNECDENRVEVERADALDIIDDGDGDGNRLRKREEHTRGEDRG